MPKRRKVALISIGTAGTMGHFTLFKRLAQALPRSVCETLIISEQDYATFLKSDSATKNIRSMQVTKQPFQRSVAGRFHHDSSDEIIRIMEAEQITHIVFSTFFDTNIINWARKKRIPCYLISYPLRDSFARLFFMRKYHQFFDAVFLLNDLLQPPPASEKNMFIVRLPLTFRPSANNRRPRLLIMCGGGGRPSAQLFLALIQEGLAALLSAFPNLTCTMITGPHHQEFRFNHPRVNIFEWSNNISTLIKKADVIISEGGYFSIHDILSQGKAGVIIPGERRTDNQELRALSYEGAGFGRCVLPEEGVERVVQEVSSLLTNPQQRTKIQQSCREYLHSLSQQPSLVDALLQHITQEQP